MPQEFITEIIPEVAPAGTVAVMSPPFTTVNAAAVPLNLTEVLPVYPLPLIETADPDIAPAGVNPLIDGILLTLTGIVFETAVHPVVPVSVTK